MLIRLDQRDEKCGKSAPCSTCIGLQGSWGRQLVSRARIAVSETKALHLLLGGHMLKSDGMAKSLLFSAHHLILLVLLCSFSAHADHPFNSCNQSSLARRCIELEDTTDLVDSLARDVSVASETYGLTPATSDSVRCFQGVGREAGIRGEVVDYLGEQRDEINNWVSCARQRAACNPVTAACPCGTDQFNAYRA